MLIDRDGTNKNKKIMQKVFDAVYGLSEGFVYIDNESHTFELIKGSEFLFQMFGETGSLHDLYHIMFTSNIQGMEKDGDYDLFVDEDFFRKDLYQSRLSFAVGDDRRAYAAYMSRISADEAIIMLQSIEDEIMSERMEQEKVETIQEAYLFSMLVNLQDDSCMSAKTPEMNGDNQDYMKITYSQWRINICNMFRESDRPLFLRMSSPEYIINTLEERQNYHLDLQMKNMQGRFIWSRLTFSRTKNFSREHPRFLYTVQDVNEEMVRLLQQESIIKAVEDQNEKLQKAEEDNRKFFYSMSHEIRTPINAIMGMNEVIMRAAQDDEVLEASTTIRNASRLLLGTVNDILDYSKIEAGKMEIVPVEYDVVNLFKNCVDLVRMEAEAKSIGLELILDEKLPKRLYGDELRISQVMINLLNNAIKYTEKGKIVCSVSYSPTELGQAAIYCCVEDSGIGIKDEDLDRILKAYERLDVKKNHRVQGTGLGMSIVAGLLEQMGSRIEIKSCYGKGSQFSFLLPQKVVDAEPIHESSLDETKRSPKEPASLKGKSVLVVDDTVTNLHVVRALLHPYEMVVDLAKSGKICLEMVKTKNYDLVLMDHMMPEMDGVETLEELRQMSEYYKNVPVVALTGNYSPTARDQYMGLGFDDYLEKPMSVAALDEVLHHMLD